MPSRPLFAQMFCKYNENLDIEPYHYIFFIFFFILVLYIDILSIFVTIYICITLYPLRRQSKFGVVSKFRRI